MMCGDLSERADHGCITQDGWEFRSEPNVHRLASAPTRLRPKAQGCETRATVVAGLWRASRSQSEVLCLLFRFPLGHRPTNVPNRNAAAAHPFPPERLTSATTPL